MYAFRASLTKTDFVVNGRPAGWEREREGKEKRTGEGVGRRTARCQNGEYTSKHSRLTRFNVIYYIKDAFHNNIILKRYFLRLFLFLSYLPRSGSDADAVSIPLFYNVVSMTTRISHSKSLFEIYLLNSFNKFLLYLLIQYPRRGASERDRWECAVHYYCDVDASLSVSYAICCLCRFRMCNIA